MRDKLTKLQDSMVLIFKTDGLGFRRFKEVVGQYQRWFVYDMGANETPGLAPLVAEYDGNGNLVAKYHSDGVGMMAMTSGNQSYWYGIEGIGTVRQLTNAQGQVIDRYVFDAWGNELTNPQSQVSNPFRYVGKHGYYLDTESALTLLGVRYYGAANGLFLSRDLIESYGYTYAADNPIRWIDPQGLQPDRETCRIVNGQRECAGKGVGSFSPDEIVGYCPIHNLPYGREGCPKCNAQPRPKPGPSYPSACSNHSKRWEQRNIHCMRVKAPIDLPWPPTTKNDIFCWAEILDKAMGYQNELCIWRMHNSLIMLYAFLRMGFNDKFIHCLAGCLATRQVDCMCAVWLSIWFEVQPLGGVIDPQDVVATLYGMDCAHDFNRCKNFPADCSVCCAQKYRP